MSLFKFNNSNFLNKPNHPDIIATTDTYNGNVFSVVDNKAVPFNDDEEIKTADPYFMFNIIDKPEILNTDDYHVKKDEFIRAWRLKDFVGEKFEISGDLVKDDYKTVAKNDILVCGTGADGMVYKKVADATGYNLYLKVVKKTTFGCFTIDKNDENVAGGYKVEVMSK